MDGLTVDGLAEISAQTNGDYALRVGDAAGSSGSVQGIGKIGINSQGAGVFTYTGTEIRATELGTSGYRAGLSFHTRGTTSDVEPLKRLDIAYNGDISFYEDTGTSQALFWDASAESLGIGTTSPNASLSISKQTTALSGTGNTYGLHLYPTSSGAVYVDALTGSTSNTDLKLRSYNNGTYNQLIGSSSGGTVTTFQTGGSERMRLTSTGLGIGTSSPSATLDLVSSGTNSQSLLDLNSASGIRAKVATDAQDDAYMYLYDSADALKVAFRTDGNNSYIAGGGNVGIGTTSPLARFDVESGTGNAGFNYGTLSSPDRGNLWYDTDGTGWRFNIGKVQAGSFTSQITIQDNGNVGIGTTSPSRQLVVFNSGNAELELYSGTTSSGFIYFRDSGDSNIGALQYNHNGNYMAFRVNDAERARITSAGAFLVGKTADNTTDIGSVVGDGYIYASRSGNIPLVLNRTTSDGFIVSIRKDNSTVGSISVTSSATSYNTSSDARLKDVTGQARGLDVINALNPVSYNWKADGKADEGLIAQEVLDLVPNAVSQNEEEYYQMDYSKLVTPLIKAVQELSNQVNELKQEIQNLKGE
jgi:hypothetical protein